MRSRGTPLHIFVLTQTSSSVKWSISIQRPEQTQGLPRGAQEEACWLTGQAWPEWPWWGAGIVRPAPIPWSVVEDPLLVQSFLLGSLVAMEMVLSQWTSDTVPGKRLFSASSNRLAKSREAWSSLVCFILCITKSYLEGTSPNEAKQQTILNTLEQSLPLYNGLWDMKFCIHTAG